MNCFTRLFPTIIAFFIISAPAEAQLSADDSSYLATARENAESSFVHSLDAQASWMNGRMNIPYPFPFDKGSPWFNGPKFVNGRLLYDSILYEQVPMMYDQISEKIISVTDKGRLELINDHVDGFELEGHKFTRIYKDTISHMRRGFYEVLYRGKMTVVSKNLKQLREELVSGIGILHSVDSKMAYYIYKNGGYYQISNKKTLLEALADKKETLQKFIKKNKLSWKKDSGRLITAAVEQYDQLTN